MTTEDRPFGCPTIRSDIPKYERRSIADTQNYGDDVNAQYLLHPGPFVAIGIEESDFQDVYPKHEIIDIFVNAGIIQGPEHGEVVWDRMGAADNERVTLLAFQQTVNGMIEEAEIDAGQ